MESVVRILAGFTVLAFSLSVLAGCSRGRGEPAPAPPTNPTPSPEAKPDVPEIKPEPEPEPEPAPGELVKLTLPKEGGVWPWLVGTAHSQAGLRPVAVPGTGAYAPNAFAVRAEVNRAVVTTRVDPLAGGKKGVDPRKAPEQTRLTLYDIALGTAVRSWVVPGSYTVLDLAPDGRSLLVTHPLPGRERGVLRLWVIGADWQLKRWHQIAHAYPGDGQRADAAISNVTEIRWAGFVGERVVSMSRGGQLRVFDTEGLKPLATIDAAPCRPAVTPDGTRVAFLVGPLVALLDPATRKITGTRWVGVPPPHAALRFSPDGTKLAIGGNGRAMILNMTTGHFQSIVLPKLDVNDNGLFDRPFDWVGSTYLLADTLLFDLELPQPVWEYSPAELVQFRAGTVWASVRAPGQSSASLQALALPGRGVEEAVAAAKARSGAFALAPGNGIKIDVTGVPEDRRAESLQVLEQRIREVGFTPDPKAAATLFASVDHPGTKPTVAYTGLGSYSYTKKPARLRLVLNNQELWNESWAVEPPFSLELAKGIALSDYLGKLSIGQPDYKAFALAPLPTHFPGPAAPTRPLGKSELLPPPAKK